MKTRIEALTRIRDEFQSEGPVAAISYARAAFEDGLIDRLDVPEVFIALKTGSWRYFDQLCRRSYAIAGHSVVCPG